MIVTSVRFSIMALTVINQSIPVNLTAVYYKYYSLPKRSETLKNGISFSAWWQKVVIFHQPFGNDRITAKQDTITPTIWKKKIAVVLKYCYKRHNEVYVCTASVNLFSSIFSPLQIQCHLFPDFSIPLRSEKQRNKQNKTKTNSTVGVCGFQ